jgi:hypothetical protein
MVYVLVSNFSQPSKPTIRKLVGTASTHCYAQATKAEIQRFFDEINSQRFKGYELRVKITEVPDCWDVATAKLKPKVLEDEFMNDGFREVGEMEFKEGMCRIKSLSLCVCSSCILVLLFVHFRVALFFVFALLFLRHFIIPRTTIVSSGVMR